MDRGEKVEAVVVFSPNIRIGKWRIHNRAVITLEKGNLVITFPGKRSLSEKITFKKNIFNIKPKGMSREDETTLRVNSGVWNYDWITLVFDSQEDADRVEAEARKILPGEKEH